MDKYSYIRTTIRNNQMTSGRIFGFDLIRTLATLVIVFHHASILISEHFVIPSTFKFPDPVDLFFVGSGFLVGRILLKTFIDSNDYSFKNAFNFLKRRWFRTFPNYYLFLIINILLVAFNLAPGRLNENTIIYFGFLQNLHKPLDLFFWESWSLVVEEWFYLIFPILLLTAYQLFKKYSFNGKHAFLAITIVLILFPTIYRFISYAPGLSWDIYFRKLAVTRMDTIGFGLLAAYIQTYYFHIFTKYRWVTFIIGTCMYLVTSLIFSAWSHAFQCTWFFTVTAIGVTLLFPLLYEWKNERIPLKPFRFIALISYSVYLWHLPIAYLMTSWFVGQTLIITLLLYVAYWSLVIVLSYLTYRYFEKPLTNLRDR